MGWLVLTIQDGQWVPVQQNGAILQITSLESLGQLDKDITHLQLIRLAPAAVMTTAAAAPATSGA